MALHSSACARDNEEEDPRQPSPEQLRAQNSLYCDLSRPAYEARGWVVARCDGAGFTSLRRLACGDSRLEVFEDADGRLHRDPEHACYPRAPDGSGSSSGFSKDHLLMRMVAAWRDQDQAWIDRFIAFAEPRAFKFCDAEDSITELSRCQASFGLIELLYAMQRGLRGQRLLLQQSEDALPDDFEAHLRVLFVWLSGKVFGGITDRQKQVALDLAARDPENAIYEAVAARYRNGDLTRFYQTLDDTRHWPKDRLPTKHGEHCTEYLYQRDQTRDGAPNDDWLPCPGEPDAEHSATEFGVALYFAEAP